ncbi:cation transporter [Salinarchaeum sp. Harcht-Bsk1]|uniref:magnesium transporter n=1 Tax=Salinarchaeum sp. Harcht-Bsk1 TaxID=1333523 RepID=UPI00034243C3|nr:magnesium transporter [Salinarchaeum sp. Harcht-Bsk1]AGN02368.1 cation transporter [Salinarchaeum sp. Harcht-Bsk1]
MDARGSVWTIYRESLPVLLASLAGGIFAGFVLGTPAMVEGFESYPGLLLALPAFLATRGNVYGALGARIASGLHQGIVEPRLLWQRRLVNAVAAAVINGLTMSAFIALASWTILSVQPGRSPAPLFELVGVLVLAALATATVLIVGLLALVFAGYRRGVDPDNLIGPIVTTLGDVFGVVFLLVSMTAVGVVT